jgi:hypothetical protein
MATLRIDRYAGLPCRADRRLLLKRHAINHLSGGIEIATYGMDPLVVVKDVAFDLLELGLDHCTIEARLFGTEADVLGIILRASGGDPGQEIFQALNSRHRPSLPL